MASRAEQVDVESIDSGSSYNFGQPRNDLVKLPLFTEKELHTTGILPKAPATGPS